MSETQFNQFLQSEMAGAIVVNVLAILSTFALVSVFLRVIWLAIRRYLSPNSSEPQEYVFFNTQLGHYAICLLLANTLNSAAGLIGVRWLVQKGITGGGVCTAQAIIMQVGNWSTAYFTVTIAVHTFNSLVLRKRQSALICISTIIVGWVTAALLAAGPFIDPRPYHFGPTYGPDGLSCGVRSVYLKAQFYFHLLPIFIASVLSAILYSVIFLVLRGTLNIKGGIKLTLDPNERWVVGSVTENYHRFVARIARSMLWYPIAYIALLLPYSIVRLLAISGFSVPFAALIFAFTCWFLLGVVNVLLLYNTFRVLGPAFEGGTTRDTESFDTYKRFKIHSPGRQHYPIAPYHSFTSDSSLHKSPQTSVRSLLPTYQERTASVSSYYSYPISPSIGRPITPAVDLGQNITIPESAVKKNFSNTTGTVNDHARQASTDSLPVPPRPTRSPVIHQPVRQQSIERVHSPIRVGVNGTWTLVDNQMSRQTSNQTFGRRNSGTLRNSANSVDLGPSNWPSQQVTNGLLTSNGMYNPPMLSAVNGGFPTLASSPSQPTPYHHRRSLSATPAPNPITNRQPVLVHRSGSTGGVQEPGRI